MAVVVAATQQVIVREATPADLDWLVKEARDFSRFNGTQYPMFEDEAHVRAGLLGLISQHFVRIAVRGDERLGFVRLVGIGLARGVAELSIELTSQAGTSARFIVPIRTIV